MNRPHLVLGTGFAQDPDFFHTAHTGFVGRRAPSRIAWLRHAEALYGNTLKLQYTGLDPAARYNVRYTQAGDSSFATRLVANGAVEIHPLSKREAVVRVVEFDIPPATTAGGTLTLEWQPDPDASGNGRFVQVSEVWLVKQ